MVYKHNYDLGLFKCLKDNGDGTGDFYRVDEEVVYLSEPSCRLVCYHWSTMRAVSL
jgi:hypothetical protein